LLHEHIAKDDLLAWAWSPGAGRMPAPGTQEQLGNLIQAWIETGDNVQAVRFGLARTGRIITSAALIIVVVGMSFAFTSILVTKAIGVGLAVAVALDASVIRILMVPAFMRLLGRWNWWLPPWLDRALPRIE